MNISSININTSNSQKLYKSDNPLAFGRKINTKNALVEKHPEETSLGEYPSALQGFDVCKYFMGLKTKNGEQIFTTKQNRVNNESLFEYLLNINPSSSEASNVSMLIELVQNGVIGRYIFDYLPFKGSVNPFVSKDIDKLYEAYSLGIESIEAFVPTFNSLDEAMNSGNSSVSYKGTYKELKIGDTFQIKGEKFIRIKTSDDTSEQLKLSKEKYFELFPPIERFATAQNKIGNCWQISAINSVLCEPRTRVKILKLFSQEGNDVVVNFPNGLYSNIRFKNSKMPNDINFKYYSKGALGVRMLEYSEGVEIQFKKILSAYKQLRTSIETTKSQVKKNELNAKLALFSNILSKNGLNVSLDIDNLSDFGLYNGNFDNAYTDSRNGGKSADLFSLLGFSDVSEHEFGNSEQNAILHDLLENPKFFDDYLVCWGTGDLPDRYINSRKVKLTPWHMYRIIPKSINKKGLIDTFKLINPWGMLTVDICLDELIKKGYSITIAKI